jgi:hypothetical protein
VNGAEHKVMDMSNKDIATKPDENSINDAISLCASCCRAVTP